MPLDIYLAFTHTYFSLQIKERPVQSKEHFKHLFLLSAHSIYVKSNGIILRNENDGQEWFGERPHEENCYNGFKVNTYDAQVNRAKIKSFHNFHSQNIDA